MSNVKITDLPALTGASSASVDVLPVVSVGTDTTSKMTRAEFFLNVPAVNVAANSSTAAVTITQTGTGNALVVEDNTSPDSTPFVIDQVGNVGIGTSTGLTKKLNLASDATYDAATRMTNSANTLGFEVGLLAGTADASAYVYQRANSVLFFGTNNLTRMTIDNSGKVGIGVTPTQTLDVNGAINMRGDGSSVAAYTVINTAFRQSGSAGTMYFDVGSSGSSGQFVFRSSSALTEIFRFSSAGQIGIGGANYGTSGQTIISAGSGAAPAWGTLPVAGGGTGAVTLTGYVKGSGTSAMTASATIPNTDVSGLGTISTQAASAVAITGGTINGASVGATTPAAVTGTSVASTSVLTSGFTTLAAGTLALAFASKGVVQVTPNATGSFTSTVPPAGTRCTLIVLTSGTTSFTMTFGTGFKTAGTLATGTVTAKTFVFQFISDGTTLIEASRTTAL